MYIPGTRVNSQRTPTQGVKYRVCGLWLCPNFGVRLRGDENVYLPLTAEKMHAFDIFTENYLQWCGCSDTNFTVTLNGINPKTRIQIETIETKITGIQIYFVVKIYCIIANLFDLSQLIELVINSRLLQPP